MDALETLKTRRSVRKYTSQEISESDMHTLLEAGMSGPSCVNSRDWSFITVRNKETLRKLAECNGMHATMLPDAAAAIVVCGDLDRAYPKAKDYWVVDCSIAAQNIIIAATTLGIGSVWLGTWPQKHKVQNIQKLFSLPDTIVPLAVVALGYPDPTEEIRPKPEFEENRIHEERW